MTKDIRPIRIEGKIAYVTLTQGYEAVIDAADVPLVEGFNWHVVIDVHTVYAKRSGRENGSAITIRMHRVIMGEPEGFEVDHQDGNGLNNRKYNLRKAQKDQNVLNQRKRTSNTSGFKGVSLHRQSGKWRAQIRVNKKPTSLGLFSTPEEAHAAYCEASAKFHGEFGRVE